MKEECSCGEGRKPIKEWGKDEMPREKFIRCGAESLSNAELLAIILRCGSRELNAVELAREVIGKSGDSLQRLRRFSLEDYLAVKGVGRGKALSVMASFELARRSEAETDSGIQITTSVTAARIIAPLLRDLPHEECWVIFLNRANRMISKERLSVGGIYATVMDSKLVVKRAISNLASGIILVHNHPSGNRLPGNEDRVMTKRLKRAAELCDLVLLDHIIIAGSRYYSFRDEEGL